MRPTVVTLIATTVALTACSSSGGGDEVTAGGVTRGGATEVADVADVAAIDVEGPSEAGGGDVPHFEWRAVEGAREYAVVVRDRDGATLWAWRGEATDIWFGGLSRERPRGFAGPVVGGDSTWRVAAFDEDGHVVAISDERTLGPG